MPARNLLAVGAGLASALLFCSIMTGSPIAMIVMPFSMLPLFLIGLSGGITPTIISGIVAIVVVAGMGSMISAIAYAAAEAIPAIIISRQAARTYKDKSGQILWTPASNLIGYITAYGAILLIAIFIGSSGLQGGFIGLVERQIATALEPMVSSNATSQKAISEIATEIARLAPGTMAAWWLAITLMSLGISHILLKRWRRNIRPELGLSRLKNPRWIILALIASLGLGLLTEGTADLIGWNLFQVLIVPFIFVGLMVIHLLCRNWGPGPIFVGLFYLFIFIRGWPILLAAVLGFAEQWVKMRERIEDTKPTAT